MPSLTVYTGKDYSISYPQGWKVTPNSVGVAFSDDTNGYGLVITVNPNPDGRDDADTFVKLNEE